MLELYLRSLHVSDSEHECAGPAIPIRRFPYLLGRHPECDYTLHDPSVSRRHCLFFVRGEQAWLKDLGSRNGTFVNGERVWQPRPVHDRDRLELGSVAFELGLPTPADEATVRLAASAEAEGTAQRRQRVLVVEDNEDTAESLALLLRAWGHEVRIAHDGAEALDAARARQPDTVLLDVRLPGMDGFQVARRLRAESGLARTRLVAMTGYDLGPDGAPPRDCGFERLLTKPVDPVLLQEVLGHAP